MTESTVRLWEKYYEGLSDSYLFPNEFVVRSFLGTYPNLTMDRKYAGARICDIACGDGRNITLLNKLGLKVSATEISEAICNITRKKLLEHPEHIVVDIRTGFNWALPFESHFFDYLLSWNACYYMKDETSDFGDHVKEFARIIKKGGYLVASVPSPKCFSLICSEDLGNNLIRINTKTRWSILNGSIYRKFESFEDIESLFGDYFCDFQRCRISDDCFGLPLDYFVFVCKRRMDI